MGPDEIWDILFTAKVEEKPKKAEEKPKKPKFKVGDRIIGNKEASKHYYITKEGWRGTVRKVEGDCIIVNVNEGGKIRTYPVNPAFFDLDTSADNKAPSRPDDRAKKNPERKPGTRRVVITITDDGATAEYIYGKAATKGVSVKRYHDDKPDDGRAALYAVAKLFGFERTKPNADFSDRDWKDLIDSFNKAMGYLDDAKRIIKKNTAAGK